MSRVLNEIASCLNSESEKIEIVIVNENVTQLNSTTDDITSKIFTR